MQKSFVQTLRDNGGFTYNPRTGLYVTYALDALGLPLQRVVRLRLRRGYAVAQDFNHYMLNNADLLCRYGYQVHAWYSVCGTWLSVCRTAVMKEKASK
jgi:hypothetical protein